MAKSASDQVVAFVHAKGVSERVPGKNMRLLQGKPLVKWAIENAAAAEMVDVVVLDTDSEKMLGWYIHQFCSASERYSYIHRPPGLALPSATGDDLAYWQACNFPDSKVMIQVVPTCPFTKPQSIDLAVGMLFEDSSLSVTGVVRKAIYQWENGQPAYPTPIPNSQDYEVTVETGGLYAMHTVVPLTQKRRVSLEASDVVYQEAIEAINIDTEADWMIAEWITGGKDKSDD